jgi:hypothetical protein
LRKLKSKKLMMGIAELPKTKKLKKKNGNLPESVFS